MDKDIQVISLDMDGTLIPKSFPDKFWLEEIPKLYSEKNDVDLEEAKDMIIDEYEKVGKKDIRWYLTDFWFDKFDLENRAEEMLKRLRNDFELYPDAKEQIQKLSQDYKLIIISRGSDLFIEIGLQGFEGYFSSLYSTVSDFQSPIKSPEIYEKICEDLGVDPSVMLHIGDDSEQDYENPREIGIESLLINRNVQRKEEREDAIESLDGICSYL